jgi:ubiquinone/menaquinone biosynthesis C-methylase UbiE
MELKHLIKTVIGKKSVLFLNKIFKNPNSLRYQKRWGKFYLASDSRDSFSDSWGKVDQFNEGLGDYRIVKTKIVSMNKRLVSVLEIGCLYGKWSEVLVENFDEVHLMDLTDDLLPTLVKKFGDKFTFHTTRGSELKSLDDDSIELIFSMDSLVRVPNSKYILDYLIEFKRVLKKRGEVYVHLPCNLKEGSVRRNFTDISKPEILKFCKMCELTLLEFDEKTLDHGILLHLIKE